MPIHNRVYGLWFIQTLECQTPMRPGEPQPYVTNNRMNVMNVTLARPATSRSCYTPYDWNSRHRGKRFLDPGNWAAEGAAWREESSHCQKHPRGWGESVPFPGWTPRQKGQGACGEPPGQEAGWAGAASPHSCLSAHSASSPTAPQGEKSSRPAQQTRIPMCISQDGKREKRNIRHGSSSSEFAEDHRLSPFCYAIALWLFFPGKTSKPSFTQNPSLQREWLYCFA